MGQAAVIILVSSWRRHGFVTYLCLHVYT